MAQRNELATVTTSAPALAFDPEWRERFWSKVDTSGECWEWTRAKAGNGYGVVCTKAIAAIPKKQDYAHRIAWMLDHGPIPEGMEVCHTCDTPACVRPDHLFTGTRSDNMRDMDAKGRRNTSFRKLSDEQVADLKSDYERGGVTFYDLADRYGISYQHAHAIVRGHRRAA